MTVRTDGPSWAEPFLWLARHPKALLVGVFAAAAAWPIWRQSRRGKRIHLEPLSQRWLAEHEWESGRHTEL